LAICRVGKFGGGEFQRLECTEWQRKVAGKFSAELLEDLVEDGAGGFAFG
jgi:hypothetical protein